MPQTAIREIDVLISTTVWLRSRNVFTYHFSIARGKGIDLTADATRLREALGKIAEKDYPYDLSSEGPDIVGISSTEYWRIECKGSGLGKQSTQRNNFDRALASVVSYYTDTLPDHGKEFQAARMHLGLGLPETSDYLRELKRRVQKPLRRRLNLWILLYQPESQTIRAVSPEDKY